MFKLNFAKEKKTGNNIELAYDLFTTLGINGNAEVHKHNLSTIEKIQQDCTDSVHERPDRYKILLKIIEIAGDSNNPDSLYIISKAYSWLKVEYNKMAIKYLELYIASGGSEYAVSREIAPYHREGNFILMSQVYHNLADKYLIDYDYDNAMKVYNSMLEMDKLSKFPYGRQLPYLGIADTYRRRNMLDNSIEIVEKANNPDDVFTSDLTGWDYNVEHEREMFYSTINRFLADYKEKKDRGYIYRPRGKKKNNDN